MKVLPKSQVEVVSVTVDCSVMSRFAHTIMTSRALNRANSSQEIYFDVELPKTAFITNFSMSVCHIGNTFFCHSIPAFSSKACLCVFLMKRSCPPSLQGNQWLSVCRGSKGEGESQERVSDGCFLRKNCRTGPVSQPSLTPNSHH